MQSYEFVDKRGEIMCFISEKDFVKMVIIVQIITLYSRYRALIVKRIKKFPFVQKTLLCKEINVNFTPLITRRLI